MNRLAETIVKFRRTMLIVAALSTIVAVFMASSLRFEANYLNLIPADLPEVEGARSAAADVPSTLELIVAIGGDDPAERAAFAERAVAALEPLDVVVSARSTVPREWLTDHWLALLPLQDLTRLADTLVPAAKKARAQANPLFIGLDDSDPWAPVEELADEMREKHGEVDASIVSEEGFVTTRDGKWQLLFVRPRVTLLATAGEFGAIIDEIEGVVASAQQGEEIPTVFSGRIVTSREEFDLLSQDMVVATLLSLLLVVLLLTISTRRLSTLFVLAPTLVVGLAWTLAATWLVVGRLNIVSGFMLPALIGLGVDFCIHIHLGYLHRLDAGASPEDAMREALQHLARPSLVAAATSSFAFAALLTGDFAGISEYGAIASVGIFLMLTAALVVLPPLALSFARKPRPVDERKEGRFLTRRSASVAIAVAMSLLAVGLVSVPKARFYNDFGELRGELPATPFYEYVMDQLGGPVEPSLLVSVSEQEARIVADVARAQGAAQTGDAPTHIGRVVSLSDFVPAEPDAAAAQLRRIKKALAPIKPRNVPEESRARFTQLRRAANVEPWTVSEIPESLTERFLTDSGKWLVLVFSREQLSNDVAFQTWTGQLDALRAASESQGVTPKVLDKWGIVARMISIIRSDFPLMLLIATLGVIFATMLSFGPTRRSLLILGFLAMGVTTFVGLMGLFGMPFNLFNVVVLPSIVGIGIDNAVHLVDGYQRNGPGSMAEVLQTRGRACLLSSATTALGFGAMIVAHHQGVHSLGTTALIGMGCTVLFTTVALPAALLLLERKTG